MLYQVRCERALYYYNKLKLRTGSRTFSHLIFILSWAHGKGVYERKKEIKLLDLK